LSRKQECFFLDSSILISYFFEIFKDKIERLWGIKTKYHMPCYISSSVKEECVGKIRDILDFIGASILSLRMHIAGEKTKTQHEIILMEPDILTIELLFGDLFRELTDKAKSEGKEPPEIEQSLLRNLEYSLIDFLEQKFKEHASLPMEELENFLAECLDKYLYIEEAFNIQMRNLSQEAIIAPDQQLVEKVCKVGLPAKDSKHVASVIQYASSNNVPTVFVSVDYKHILSFQVELYDNFKLQVSDPIYALHHLRNEDAFKELVTSRKRRVSSAILTSVPKV